MRLAILVAAALSLDACVAGGAGKSLPEGGMTLNEVAAWLNDKGYQATVETEPDGSRNVESSADGAKFHVYMFDCKNDRCTSMQFSAGFSTKGAFDAYKMDNWDRTKRWGRAYVDDVNDPWVEYDVDLSPGGTYDMLNDELGVWRHVLADFRTFIGW